MISSLKDLAAGLRSWRVRRIAIRELAGLSDLALQDIGIHRGQIRSVVNELLTGTELRKADSEAVIEVPATIAFPRPPVANDRTYKDAA